VKLRLDTPPARSATDAPTEGNESPAAGGEPGGSGLRRFTEAEEAVRVIMARELDLAPLKTGLELALYVTLLVWGFFGARWFRALLLSANAGWSRAFVVAGALSWMVGWAIAVAPLVICDYGRPPFTDWMGPGALSWSTGHPVSWGSGLTVSYRTSIETAALWPRIFLEPTAVARALPRMSKKLLLVGGRRAGLLWHRRRSRGCPPTTATRLIRQDETGLSSLGTP
jgi:hypothetical protein